MKITAEELQLGKEIYNNKIESLVKLGKVKLSEIQNKKITEDTYLKIIELNTREDEFTEKLRQKYGDGSIDISTGEYIINQQ